MAFNLADVLRDVSDSGTNREQIEYISLSLIDEDPNNFYQLTDIPLLADNMSLCGLQQPIRVWQQENGRYMIVSGHRRRAALEMLVEDGYEQWKEAPCIVERDEVSPALQQLRLIYANASTRKMSNAELGEQAEQVEKLLYQLKEEGYEFPGRMRDHVAEAVGASKSKLARLKVIRENLGAVWVDAYKGDLIGESVAYALSQMPKSWQTILHKVWGEKPKSLYADTVTNSRDRFQKITKLQCEHGLTLCEHTVTMMEKACKEMYYSPCIRCCFDCSDLQACKNCCPQAAGKQKELRAADKAAKREEKQHLAELDRPGAEFARLVYQRIGEARTQNGVSVKELTEARGVFYSEAIDVPKQRTMESGDGQYSSNTYLPFGVSIRACDMMQVVAVADLLHCSVDYLLGRTERMELVSESGTTPEPKENVSNSGTILHTEDPPAPGEYLLMLQSGGCYPQYEKWCWDGMFWHDWSGQHVPILDGEIRGWIPLPKLPEGQKPANNESCISGMSGSGHCGAAAYCPNEYACCLQCPDESCNGRCGWIEVEES